MGLLMSSGFPPLSVAALAAWRVDRPQLLKIKLGDGLKLVSQSRSFEVIWQVVEPSAVFVLQIDQHRHVAHRLGRAGRVAPAVRGLCGFPGAAWRGVAPAARRGASLRCRCDLWLVFGGFDVNPNYHAVIRISGEDGAQAIPPSGSPPPRTSWVAHRQYIDGRHPISLSCLPAAAAHAARYSTTPLRDLSGRHQLPKGDAQLASLPKERGRGYTRLRVLLAGPQTQDIGKARIGTVHSPG